MSDPLATFVARFEGSEEAPDNFEIYVEQDVEGVYYNADGLFPGNPFYFLIKLIGNVEITRILATNGEVYHESDDVVRIRKDTCLFTELSDEEDRPTSSYPVLSITDTYWFGNEGGPIQIRDDKTFDIITGVVPSVAEVSYSVAFDSLWRLEPGTMVFRTAEEMDGENAETSYTIHIVIYLRNIT